MVEIDHGNPEFEKEPTMFFIYDCNNVIVGNPKGYPSIRGASRQANSRALQDLLWGRFEASKVDGFAPSARVWSIREKGESSFEFHSAVQ